MIFTITGWVRQQRTTIFSEDMMTDTTTAADAAATAPEVVEPTGETRLKFEHLSMVFPDGTHAINDVSFEVDAGEFVTVVGPVGVRQVDAVAHRLRTHRAHIGNLRGRP